jgi:hypothetical protein
MKILAKRQEPRRAVTVGAEAGVTRAEPADVLEDAPLLLNYVLRPSR